MLDAHGTLSTRFSRKAPVVDKGKQGVSYAYRRSPNLAPQNTFSLRGLIMALMYYQIFIAWLQKEAQFQEDWKLEIQCHVTTSNSKQFYSLY